MIRKSHSFFLILFLIFPVLAAEKKFEITKKLENIDARPAFISHADWLAVPLAFAPIEKLRLELEKQINKKLQHRGEAHITLITPPEWSTLSQILKMEDIEKIAEKQKMMKAPFKIICLKKVAATLNGKEEESWFLAVESPELLDIRQEIWRLYVARNGDGEDFKWKRWAPHITVGFTARDLYDQDHINKSSSDCSFETSVK